MSAALAYTTHDTLIVKFDQGKLNLRKVEPI